MKKIILIILATFISLFIFNFNVEALNSDATATCVYSFPPTGASSSASKDFYTGVTIKYDKGVATGTCNKTSTNGNLTSISGILTGNCEVDVDYSYFEDPKTGALICPTVFYYESYKVTYSGYGGGEYTFKVIDAFVDSKLTDKELRKATVHMQIKPSSSKINQGTDPLTDAERAGYMNCECGEILLKTTGAYFNDKNANWNEKHLKEYPSFDIANMKACPEKIFYQVMSTKLVKVADWDFNKGKTTEIACVSTAEMKSILDSKKNDTNFIEQEDVILPFCDETSKMWKIFGYLINALKVLVPVLIIVLGSVDLGKAVVAQNEDEMKKATQLLIKRVIAGIIIFFIPTIVSLIFKIASNYSVYFNNGSGCIQCITKPGSC